MAFTENYNILLSRLFPISTFISHGKRKKKKPLIKETVYKAKGVKLDLPKKFRG